MKGSLRFESFAPSLFLSCLLLLNACREAQTEWVENANRGAALGTTYNITYHSDRKMELQPQIDSVFAAVNQSMSTYIPDSDISRINRGDTLAVDAMFREVFELSKEVFKETDGYFDPTVGTLVNAWGFGPGEALALDSAKVDSLLEYVGLQKVKLSDEDKILKGHPEIQIDFNAIAKGYAIDRLAAMLEEQGLSNFLVEVGGEIVTRGENKMKKKDWVVGIDDPQAEGVRRLKRTLRLRDKALASSGNYRKFRIDSISGRKYVHTINPKTGFTKNSSVLAASVIAPSCARADAYATAFMAMDLDESIALLSKAKELEAYIIYLDENGNPKEYFTPAFEALLVN